MKTLKLTHTDKLFWPNEGYTKGDVIAYYALVAPYILPHLKGRPQSLNRQPGGINDAGFYQKDFTGTEIPAFVKTSAIYSESNKKDLRWVVCDNKETLLWLANMGCIELNPWQSRLRQGSGGQARLNCPDYVTIDIDPNGRPFSEVVEVVLAFKKLCDRAKIPLYPKTSGKSGMHLMIPLGAKYTYTQARRFAELVVALGHAQVPTLTTLEWRKAKRGKKIFLDIARNAKGQTTAAVYSLRPYPGATISTPLEWREVNKKLSPAQFNLKTIFPRLKKKGDLFKGVLGKGADLKRAAALLTASIKR